MSRRLFVVAAILVWSHFSIAVTKVSAQNLTQSLQHSKLLFLTGESTAPMTLPAPAETSSAAAAPAISVAPVVSDAPQVPVDAIRSAFNGSRSKSLLPLYASTAVLQALDVHSTMQVLRQGGGEGNPMLQGVAQHQAVFIATKAALAATTMYAASRIAKRSRIGAVVALVGMNGVYALVVSHNYRLAHDMR